MKKHLSVFFLFFTFVSTMVAAPPVPFSGKLAVDGKNFQGSALFAFSIIDGEEAVHWKHTQENNATIENFVVNGRYFVLLGGQGMQTLPANLFLENDNLSLRVRVDLQDGQGVRLLQPDQPITSTPYALAAEIARLAEKASVADGVTPGAITAGMVDKELLADLNKTITISDLPEEVVESMNRPITREMLPKDVQDDLNRTIGVSQLSAEVNEKLNRDFTIQPASISKSLLGQDVLGDLNRTILRHHLSDELRAELNRTITKSMLSQEIKDDLNRTITRAMLPQDVRDDLNRTIGVAQLSAEVNEKLNRDFTIQAGSISKALLGQDVLGDLNRTILRHNLSEELRAELNRTIRLRDLSPGVIADLNDSIASGSITLNMLAGGVRDDLNRTITKSMLAEDIKNDLNRTITLGDLAPEVITDLNDSIQQGSITLDLLSSQVRNDLNRTITKSMLSQDIKDDLNHTITLNDLAPEVIADLNDSIAPGSISLDMLASGVRADLNRTITLGNLAPEVIADLNDSIQQGSITLDLLSSQVRSDLNRTITKSMLSQEVLNELNSSSGVGGVVPGSLLAVPAKQSAPSGYELYQMGDRKNLVWEEKATISPARWAYDGVAVLNEKIYFVGGNNSSSIHDRVDRYNPVSNTWSTVASMSTVRGRLAVAVLGGKLYAIGGNDASSTLSSVEIYDPSTDTWTAGPPLPSPAKQAAVITVSDKIYLIGGTNNSGLNLNQVLYLESGSSEWVALANMPTARHAHKVAWYQNRIWAIGGYSEAITGNVESYDPSTNSWRTEPSLISVRRYHSAWVAHESIFVAGGQISSGTYESSTQRFDIHVNSWKSFGTLPEAKVVSDSAILNGSVYIIGGHDGSVSSAKVFAADLNASVSGVFDLYRKDGNASSGVPTVQAEVADGSITTNQLSEQILKYLKPEITTQPQPTASTIFADTNHTLSVSAEGKYLTYQWKKNGTALAGETNATLTITDANSTQHDGNYTVVVSNDFGGVESGEVEILINHSLLDGLIAWWKFDETSGTVAYDSSGNGHDANLTNGPTWVTGKIGGALSFDGSDDMVRTGVSGMYNQDFTWSTWIKTSHTSGAVVGVSADSWSGGGSSLYIFGGKPKIDVCNIGNKLGSLSINTNQWVHYLLTVEDSGGSSDPVKIFVNGQINVDSQMNWFGFSGQAFNLRIGHVPVHGNYYLGIIDDVRIYDRVLSNAEVQDLHQLGQ